MPCGCKKAKMPGAAPGAQYEVELPDGTIEGPFGSAMAAQARARRTGGTFRPRAKVDA